MRELARLIGFTALFTVAICSVISGAYGWMFPLWARLLMMVPAAAWVLWVWIRTSGRDAKAFLDEVTDRDTYRWKPRSSERLELPDEVWFHWTAETKFDPMDGTVLNFENESWFTYRTAEDAALASNNMQKEDHPYEFARGRWRAVQKMDYMGRWVIKGRRLKEK